MFIVRGKWTGNGFCVVRNGWPKHFGWDCRYLLMLSPVNLPSLVMMPPPQLVPWVCLVLHMVVASDANILALFLGRSFLRL